MRTISLFHTLALSLSLLSTILCVVLAAFFATSYYNFADQEIKTVLVQTTSELTSNYLISSGGQIKFLEPANQISLANILRTRDLAAVIYTPNMERVSTFGVYRLIYDQPSSQAIAEAQRATQAVQKLNRAQFAHLDVEGITYEIYTVPLKEGENVVGYLQLAKQSAFLNRLTQLMLTLLAVVLPPSLVLVWFVSYKLVSLMLRPLHALVELFSTLSVDSLPQNLATKSKFSEMHSLVESCNAMIRRVRDGVENQKNFTSFVSHELKTPLTRAISSLDVQTLSGRQPTSESLAPIVTDLESLSRTLDSLLALLQPFEKTATQSTNLNSLFKLLESEFGQMHTKSPVLEFKSFSALEVLAQSEHLRMLLHNLISNALKYTPASGQVTVSTQVRGQIVSITVTDTGPGISASDSKHIFQPFFRTHSAQAMTSTKGIGLGLALVKRIAEYYGWQLKLDSTPGHGASFTVTGMRLVQNRPTDHIAS